MTILIAEISNMHLGDMDVARELIKTAKECGADIAKGQAFMPSDMLQHGVMSKMFYQMCSFSFSQYVELIEYGEDIGIPVFFSIISPHFYALTAKQKYKKITAKQFVMRTKQRIRLNDKENYFISMNVPRTIPLKKANLMYAQGYGKATEDSTYQQLVSFYQRPIGISHHNKDISDLKIMANCYDLPVIEKHFYFGSEIKDENGQIYRDCLHAADPKTFEELARIFK